MDMFSRNIKFWGDEKQKILADSSILIAGVGGLGCTVAEVLTRAGIGKLILIDNDIVDVSNMNRQILYDNNDIGKSKVQIAKLKLQVINPKLKVEVFQQDISGLKDLHLPHFDGIVDCLDNFTSRFELEKLLSENQFLVHGGVQNDFGQITTIIPNKTQSLKEIYPGIHIPVAVPVVPQSVITIGSMMAQEIINNIFDKPQLINSMLIIELSDFSMFKVKIEK